MVARNVWKFAVLTAYLHQTPCSLAGGQQNSRETHCLYRAEVETAGTIYQTTRCHRTLCGHWQTWWQELVTLEPQRFLPCQITRMSHYYQQIPKTSQPPGWYSARQRSKFKTNWRNRERVRVRRRSSCCPKGLCTICNGDVPCARDEVNTTGNVLKRTGLGTQVPIWHSRETSQAKGPAGLFRHSCVWQHRWAQK